MKTADVRGVMNLADFSDTSSLVPCRRCAELLQEGDRFCRLCGQDQFDTGAADEARSVTVSERGIATRRGARSPIKVDFAAALQPEAQAGIADIGRVRPAAFGQQEVSAGGGPWHWLGRSVTAYRLVIGLMAVLVVVLALALGHDFYRARQGQAGAPPVPTAKGEPMRPVPAQAPMAAAPAPGAPAPSAPGTAAADPKAQECNEALTALAICPKP